MSGTVWELSYHDATRQETSRHDDRKAAVSTLAGHLVDAGVTVRSDPTAATRNATGGDFSATLTAPDGSSISYAIRSVKVPDQYLNLAQFAERINVAPKTMSRYKLPDPDVVVGPVNEDGTIPRGTVRGWLPETIDAWDDSRPGRGARTDVHHDGKVTP